MQQGGQGSDGRGGTLAQVEPQLGGKADGAQHAHRILAVAGFRIADQLQHTILQILQATVEVVQAEILDAVVEGIDGKVAAFGILFYGAVDVVTQQHAFIRLAGDMLAGIDLVVVAAEGGYLDHVTAKYHMGQTEAASHQTAVGEEFADLLRGGVGRHIEILGRSAQQQIAHTSAHQIGLITCFIQAIEHLQGVVTDLASRDRMLIPAQDQAITVCGHAVLLLAKYLATEICDVGKNDTPPGDYPLAAARYDSAAEVNEKPIAFVAAFLPVMAQPPEPGSVYSIVANGR